MAKHRKTLQQKKIADLRHKFYSLDGIRRGFNAKNVPFKTSSSSFWEASATPESDLFRARPRDSRQSQNDGLEIRLATLNKYPYLLHDISKTGILTLSIIAIQLILFVLLKNHILVLPMVKY